jgi:hypothetical protein
MPALNNHDIFITNLAPKGRITQILNQSQGDNWKVVGPGAQLAGLRVNRIVIDSISVNTESKQWDTWFAEVLQSRLIPNAVGLVIYSEGRAISERVRETLLRESANRMEPTTAVWKTEVYEEGSGIAPFSIPIPDYTEPEKMYTPLRPKSTFTDHLMINSFLVGFLGFLGVWVGSAASLLIADIMSSIMTSLGL